MEIESDIFTVSETRRVQEIDLVPLINIVFLLLIFFLITAQALVPEDALLKRPVAQTSQYVDDNAIQVSLSYDKSIDVDGRLLAKNEIQKLPEFFEKTLNEHVQRQVIIYADARLPAQYLTQMLQIISRSGAQNIVIATQHQQAGLFDD